MIRNRQHGRREDAHLSLRNRRSIMKKLFLATILAAAFGLAFAHSGGTDAKGCHHDTRTGTYHCH